MDIDFDGVLTDTLGEIAAFIPGLIAFLLILIIGYFISKWIRKLIVSLLKRIRFDEYVDKSGLGAPLERAGYADSGRFLAQIIYYLMMLLVLKLALSAFGENDISDALDSLIDWIPQLLIAIVIIIVTGLVANGVSGTLRPMLSGVSYGGTLASMASAAIWVIGGFAAIDQIGFARDIVETLFTAMIGSLGMIMVIKFGVGGIWAARDYFWPAFYSKFSDDGDKQDQPQA